MTIQQETTRSDYVGSGNTSVFTVGFPYQSASDLLVLELNTTTNAVTTLVLNSDYTESSGTITLTNGNLPVGYTLSIIRAMSVLQLTSYTVNSPFPAKSHEAALDKLTMLVQQLKEQLSRTVTFSPADVNIVNTLPPSGLRAGQYLAFDSSGNPTVAGTLPTNLYYGAYSTAPTLRPGGSAMKSGDLYFNTSTSIMNVYTGTTWAQVGTTVPVTAYTQQFSGNASTTVFTLTYPPAFQNACEVFISGVAQVPGVDYTVTGGGLNTLTFTTAPPTGTNNIYVRTIGAYSGGVPNDGSVTNAKLAFNGGALGMRNRIINGGMGIDQRNSGAAQTLIAGTPAYTVDRWLVTVNGINTTCQRVLGTASTYKLQINGVAGITSMSVKQRLESINSADLAGKTVTVSATLASSMSLTAAVTLAYANATENFSSTTSIGVQSTILNATETRYSWSFSVPAGATTGLELTISVGAHTSGSFTIGNVQLEEGPTATAFEFRPRGYELAMCQRYFCQQTASYALAQIAGSYVYTHFFPQQFRATPTLAIVTAPTYVNSSSFAANSAGPNWGAFTWASSLSYGYITGAVISGSAEL